MSDRSPTPMFDFLREVQEEFNNFMLGEYLGGGEHRAVYETGTTGELVCKVERPSAKAAFCNVTEWNVWNHLAESDAGNWLAPCCSISRQGSFLIQMRCKPITPDKIPTRVPWFFSDVHEKNWGLYQGRPVLFDYGFLWGFMKHAASEKKVRLVSRAYLDRKTKKA